MQGGRTMNANTMPLEAATRLLIDRNLENLGWKLTGKDQNVYCEQPRTEAEKKNRLATLNELINKYALENNLKLKDKIVPVLIEGVSEKDDTILTGYTDTNKLVNVKAPIDSIGKIIDVKITDVKTWSLDGEIN